MLVKRFGFKGRARDTFCSREASVPSYNCQIDFASFFPRLIEAGSG